MDSPVSTRAALLQALVRGEGYGFLLISRVDALTRGKVRLHEGSVYPALRELAEAKLVKARSVAPPPGRGGRTRYHYALTAKGRAAAESDRRLVAELFGLHSKIIT